MTGRVCLQADFAEVFLEHGALLKPIMRCCYALCTVTMDAAVQAQRLCLHCEMSLHGASTQVRIAFLSNHMDHSHCSMALPTVPCLHTWRVIHARFFPKTYWQLNVCIPHMDV